MDKPIRKSFPFRLTLGATAIVGLGIGLYLALSGRLTIFLTDRYVASLNRSLPSLRQIDITIHGLPAEVWVSSYDQAGKIKKISARFGIKLGAIERDYYYDNGAIRFVHEQAKLYRNSDFKELKKEEDNWFYFENGKMTTWFAGSSKEKKKYDEAFKAQEDDVLRTSSELSIALRPSLAWKQVPAKDLKQFLPGKEFWYSCVAGETGKFLPDGTIQASANLDFSSTDTRSGKSSGKWQANGLALTISGTLLSDETYDRLLFEEKDGVVIAATPRVGCGLTIGPDQETIKAYESLSPYEFEIYVDPQFAFSLRFPEEWIGSYVVSYTNRAAAFHYKKDEGTKNWLFDIYWKDLSQWEKRDGEIVLYENKDIVWVGRLRTSNIPVYDGPDKKEFELLLSQVPYIFKSFTLSR